ncbi:MAG: xanthine dehydrogenase family protein molybdopterin-binding subunit [Thermoproteus sp.]
MRELWEVVNGQVEYIDDIRLPGETYLFVLRSPYPHAVVKAIAPPKRGLLFLTSKELTAYMPARDVEGVRHVARMPVLAVDRVKFVGQPVAAVLVEDKYEGEDVLDEAYVDYEPLPSISTIEQALRGDVIVHEGAPDNISVEDVVKGGDLDAFNKAEVVVESEVRQSRVVPNPLEPKGCVAYFDGEVLHMYVSTQAPFRVRQDVAEALGLPPERISVKAPRNVGGGFGNKVPAYPEYVIAAYASMRLRRPVKWIETRREHLNNPTHGRDLYSKVQIYARRDGKIIGIRGSIIVNIGAYNFTINTRAARFIASLLMAPYEIEAVDLRAVGVYTNLPPTGPYRGGGRPEAALIQEFAVERLAEELGLDPFEVRVKNAAGDGFKTPTGWQLGPYGGRALLARAAEVYRDVTKRYPNAGVGVAFFAEHVRVVPGESCRIRIEGCKVRVGLGGIGPHGQAHRTAFQVLASRLLGISQEDVVVELADTEASPWGVGSFGSRSLSAGAGALYDAVQKLMAKTRELGLQWPRDICRAEGLEVVGEYKGQDAFGGGVHIAVVELDPDTLRPEVKYYYAVDNVGNILLEDEVRAQIEGGIAQGVSQVFFEEAKYDSEGNPAFMTIADTGFPTAEDLRIDPHIDYVVIPSPNPGGFLGVGETGTTGGLAAAYIAVYKAMRKLGLSPRHKTPAV